MRARRVKYAGQRGFTLTELLATIAVIIIMSLAGLPFLLTYLPSVTLAWATRDMQSALNRAKLLAVTTRQSICVQVIPGGYQFLTGNCAGTSWKGPGTDSGGTFWLPNNITASDGGTSPIFTKFGTASQAGTITVTGPGGQSRTVSVSAMGQIAIP